MAESAVSQYVDQFSCPVCLDRLREPVTIPCQCICCLCIDNHKGHSVVSVVSEWTSKKEELKEMREACLKLIEERESGQQELNEAVKLLKSSALETIEDVEKVFTELICSLEKKRFEIKEQIRAQEKTETDRAEELHKHLNQELTELRKRQAEIEKLLIAEDQIQFLKNCQTVCVLPRFENVPSFTQHTCLSFKDISISVFRDILKAICQQQTAKISQEVSNVHVAEPPEPKTANEFLQYFCQLQLNADTAGKKLKLSNSNTKASFSDEVQKYPDHPERFEFSYVLYREDLYSRCYWEVECSGNEWAVGVCYKGIGRKGNINECRLGANKQSWRFGYYQENICFMHDKKLVSVPPVPSSRIGVYLDHSAGSLSFYSVSDSMILLQSRPHSLNPYTQHFELILVHLSGS